MRAGKLIQKLLSFVLFLVILAVFVRIVFIVKVTGNSMNPGLTDGDWMFTIPIKEIAYGDIVITTEHISYGESIIKRVIALEGDVVELDTMSGILTVNGEALDEPYIAEKTAVCGDITFPYTVPDGCAFLLGDNRNHSVDSRFQEVGSIPLEQIERKMIKKIEKPV